MVKAYLRYDGHTSLGVIASRESNVAVDHTGALALTGCVEAVGVWNVRQGVQTRTLRTSRASDRVTRLCLFAGARPLCAVGYSDGTVRLWNYEEATVLQTLQGHRSAVSCLAFDSSGHMLASGSNDTDIVLWDVASEGGVARLRGHTDQVTSVLFWESGDLSGEVTSRVISSSKDRILRIWSIELQLCLQTIPEQQELWSLTLNASQTRLAVGSADQFLRLWILRPSASGGEGDPLATFYGAVPRTHGQGGAVGVEFVRPGGLPFEVLLCQGAGRTMEMFRCHDEKETKKRWQRRKRRKAAKLKKEAEKHEGTPKDAEKDEEGGEEDDGEEAHAADEITELPLYRSSAKMLSMAWCPSKSSAILGLTNNSFEVVRLAQGTEEENGVSVNTEVLHQVTQHGHRTGVRALAVSHDDSLLLSTSAEAVKIWNAATCRCVRTMESGYGLCGFFVVGNEHVIVGTKEGQLELFDLRIAERTQQEQPHQGAIYGLAQHPDHKTFCTCSADKRLRFFDIAFEGEQVCSFSEATERVTELPDEGLAVVFSPNGRWVAVALLNNTVQLMFADTLKFYLSLYGHHLPVMSIDISSDSQILASGSADKNVKLWSTQFGNCHRSLRAHEESVTQVRFLPGTHYLASASRDKEVKLWDCDSYELIRALRGHASEVLALALSQDAAFIVSGSTDRQIRFWRRGQEQLFLSEEREKDLEEKFEQEVEREDLQQRSEQAAVLRPSRRTVESVRSTERLMEVLDEAATAAETEGGQKACARVVKCVSTLTASNIYEVLLALPFSHSLRLLQFTCRFLEALSVLPGDNQAKLSAAAALETPCQAVLITTYVHHSELAATPAARPLVLRLRGCMRELLQAEKDRIGLSMAGFAHLQRTLGRGGLPAPPAAKAEPAAGKKKRKR